MKIGIMQPYFFPYLGYFQLIHAVDKYLLYDDLSYIKEGWVNRNRILNKSNGKPVYLTVPIEHKTIHCHINEVKISNGSPWKKKLLNAIFLNYKKAREFESTYNFIEGLLRYETDSLSQLNKNAIASIAERLGIKTPIILHQPYYQELEERLQQREQWFSNYNKEEYPVKIVRVLEICRREHCADFYNAIGGKTLYPKDLFFKNGIKAGFIETKPHKYNQGPNDFISGLSIIDVMMHNSSYEISQLLNAFEIV